MLIKDGPLASQLELLPHWGAQRRDTHRFISTFDPLLIFLSCWHTKLFQIVERQAETEV